MYEKIKRWHSMGLWNDSMVAQALDKKVITQEQYKSIIQEEK